MPPPPPPPPPPPAPPPGFGGKPAAAPKSAAPNRGALLADIRGGMKLKKAVTNDRSAPQVAGNTSTSNSKPTIPLRSNALNKRLREMLESNAAGKTSVSSSGGGDRGGTNGAGDRPQPVGGFPANNIGALIANQASRLRSVSSSDAPKPANGPMRALPTSTPSSRAPPAYTAPPSSASRAQPAYNAPPSSASRAPPAYNTTSSSVARAPPAHNAHPAPRAPPTHNAFPSSRAPPAHNALPASTPATRVPPPPPQNTKPATSNRKSISGPPGASSSPRPFSANRPVSVYSQSSEPKTEPLRPAVSTSQLPYRSPDSGYSPSPQGWRRSPSCGNVAEPQPPPPPPPASKPFVPRAIPPPLPPNKPPVKAHAPMPPALPTRQRPPSFSASSSISHSQHEYANGQVGGEPILRRQLSSSTSSLTAGRAPPPPPPRTSRPPPPPPQQPMRAAPRPPSEVSQWENRFGFRPMASLPPPPAMKVGQKRYPSQRTGPRQSVYDRRPSAPHPPARPPR